MALKMFSSSRKSSQAADGAKPAVSDSKFRIFDNVIFFSLAAIFFLMPVFFTGLAAQGLGFEKLMLFYLLTLLGAVAWVTKGIMSGEMKIKRTPIDIPLLAMVVVFMASTVLSVSRKDSIFGNYGSPAKGLAAVFIFTIFYYLLVNNVDAKKIKRLFWLTVGSASLLVVYGILQVNGWFILPFDFARTTNFNPFGSLTALSMALVILLPFLVIAAIELGKRGQRAWTIGKAALFAVALADLALLFILNGFTYWPIAVAGIVIVLMFFLSKVIEVSNNDLAVPVAVFLLLIIFLVFGNINLFNKNLPAEVSLSRASSFNIAKESLKKDPFFGSGPSTFYYSFAKYKPASFNATALWNVRFDSATGYLYELFATVGALGALAVVALILTALSINFLALTKVKDPDMQVIMLASFSSLIMSMLFALMFSLNNSILILMFLMSVFATVTAINIYPEKWKVLELSFRTSPKYALALAAVFLTVTAGVAILLTMGVKLYVADYYAKKSLTAADVAEKKNFLEKSISLAPRQDAYFVSLANQYMALANQSALANQDQAAVQQYLNQAIQAGKSSIEINPLSAANNESLALIYENASFYTRGALEWSEQHYKSVQELDPANPTPHLRMALINMARANVETDQSEKDYYVGEAIKKYDDALKIKPDFAAAYYGKAIASEKLNKLDDAIEQLKNAAVLAGQNQDYVFELGRLYFNRGVSKQPNLNQDASKQIAENEVSPDEEAAGPNLSVNKNQPAGSPIESNEDLKNAEQLFMSVVNANPNHANSLYSLALLYQKLGEDGKAEDFVNKLLNVLSDEKQKEMVRQQFSGLF